MGILQMISFLLSLLFLSLCFFLSVMEYIWVYCHITTVLAHTKDNLEAGVNVISLCHDLGKD